MQTLLARRPSPAMVLAFVAVLVALSGTAAALPGKKRVKKDDLATSSVGKRAIARGGVGASEAGRNSIGASELRTNAVTGDDTDETTLGKVPSATQADNATAIADNSVTSSKVQDGSLTGADVGRAAGTSVVNLGTVNAGTCNTVGALVASGVDMRDDAISATPDQGFPANVSLTTENSDSVGFIRFTACNVSGANIAVGNRLIHWVAFDS